MAVSVTEIVNALNIGVVKDPVKDATLLVLDSWSKVAIEAVRKEFLDKSLSKAGTSAQSIQALPVKVSGSKYKIEITADEAVEFANYGVSGTEIKYDTPYSFKHPRPSKSHVDAILKWIPNASLTATTGDYKSYAYAIATNVKKHGIKPKNFLSAGFNEESEKSLAEALAEVIGKAVEVKLTK